MRSKQHSFIAQLSARVQEVYYFASLLSLCTGVSYKLTEQLMWKTMNTYAVIINTKTDRKPKEIKHGAVKKKTKISFFFCFELNSVKSHLHTHTHKEFAHKPVFVLGRVVAQHHTACCVLQPIKPSLKYIMLTRTGSRFLHLDSSDQSE